MDIRGVSPPISFIAPILSGHSVTEVAESSSIQGHFYRWSQAEAREEAKKQHRYFSRPHQDARQQDLIGLTNPTGSLDRSAKVQGRRRPECTSIPSEDGSPHHTEETACTELGREDRTPLTLCVHRAQSEKEWSGADCAEPR